VPVDERVGGFDRRSIWPGVVLLVVWAIWAHLMPWINSQVALHDPIVAGDVINLGNGELSFVPPVGWNLDSGLRLTPGSEQKVAVPSSTAVSSELVSYSVAVGFWDGTTDGLLDRMLKINDSLKNLVAKDEQGRTSVASADGAPGRAVYVRGADESVLIVAFVFAQPDTAGGSKQPGIGVEIEVRGQTTDLQDQIRDIATMIATTTYQPSTKGASA
jgi:hypothetical protein